MMKNCMSLVLTLLCSVVFCSGNKVIDERIEKMHRYHAGGCCSVSWKNRNYHAEILSIEGHQVTVRVLDPSLPIDSWPRLSFDRNEICPASYKKCDSLESLVESLKYSHTLVTPIIEQAFREIDRGWFCLETPYYDAAIDIGCKMCISSPHMHIWYLELSKDLIGNAKKILDVGTGTGYLAAIFAYLAPDAEVYGLEYYDSLTHTAANTIQRNLPKEASRISFITTNGEKGYLEGAPYDIITVGFMCEGIPQPLVDQLKPGGRLILPVAAEKRKSSYDERLSSGDFMVIDKKEDGNVEMHRVLSCSFIPSQTGN